MAATGEPKLLDCGGRVEPSKEENAEGGHECHIGNQRGDAGRGELAARGQWCKAMRKASREKATQVFLR
eukprot:5197779-Prymnesium_polylepis.1